MSWDYSLEIANGLMVAHRPDCPAVRALADSGEPVATLFDCQVPLSENFPRHSCLAEEEKP